MSVGIIRSLTDLLLSPFDRSPSSGGEETDSAKPFGLAIAEQFADKMARLVKGKSASPQHQGEKSTDALDEPGTTELLQPSEWWKLGVLTLAPVIAQPVLEAGERIGVDGLKRFYERGQGRIQQFISYFEEYDRRCAEAAKKYEEIIQGSTFNPSLQDLAAGGRFVVDQDYLNQILGESFKPGPKDKVRDLSFSIGVGKLEISGTYATKIGVGWASKKVDVEFKAIIDLEIHDGKTSGALRKVEAEGFDIQSFVETDIQNALLKIRENEEETAFAIPENPELRDLSWLNIPGVKRLEALNGKLLIETEAAG